MSKRNKQKKGFVLSTQNQALIAAGVLFVVAILVYFVVNVGKTPTENTTASAPQEVPAASADEAAPLAEMLYSSAPEMSIDQSVEYYAKFTLEKGGTFTTQLYADKAPITVNSFVFLAREGYFNGVTFHRVLEGFMAQSGDRTGTGAGGPGYEFINEDSDLTFDKPGVLAMANAGRDTNGSQFFITFAAAEFLNGGYTIFGQVVEGMDVVKGITRRDPMENPNFTGDVISSIEIIEK